MKFTARCIRGPTLGLLLLSGVLFTAPSLVFAGLCLKDDSGLNNPACTANDVQIGLITSPSNITCQIGEVVELDLQVQFYANAVARYDVGAYLATGDNDAKAAGGLCQKEILSPPLENGAPYNPVGGPWRDLDSDLCGDILEADGTNTDYVADFMYTCRDGNDDGQADIGTCTFWDNNDKDYCGGEADAKPGTGAKCRCELIPIGNVYIAGNIVVDKVTVGDSTALATPFDFNVTGSGTSTLNESFQLADATTPWDSGSQLPTGIDGAGTYSVVETAKANFQTSVSCVSSEGGTENPTAIDLGSGETVTCTFTNTQVCPTVNNCTSDLCGQLTCDPTGSVGNCDGPPSYSPSTTVCRTAAGVCDVAESCTGSSIECPVDGLSPSTTICRTATGVCDVAESCTGSSADCPTDGFSPSTTICRTATGVCDVAESCTGSGADCPTDGFSPSTTICRSAENECDDAESCTGSGALCPPANPTPVCDYFAGCSPGFWRNHTELWDGGSDDLTGSTIKTTDTWGGTLGISSCAGNTNLGTMTFGDTIANSSGRTNNTLFHFTSCLLNSDTLNDSYPGSFPATGLPAYLGSLGALSANMAAACADPEGASPTLAELRAACVAANDHDEIMTFCPFDDTPDPFTMP